MIELKDHQLRLSFPQVHPDAQARIEFQRTLRIPDDDQHYPLPAGLGRFPLDHVDDFVSVPERWKTRGGVLMPIWQAEAAWINFDGDYPMAIKVAAGKINAVTGEAWTNELSDSPQDYVVIPGQRWLDGFCVGEGSIRQFVAMPLGQGVTAEEQITGEAEHGGLQIIAYPMRWERYQALMRERERQRALERERKLEQDMSGQPRALYSRPRQPDMGMAPGGLMQQQIEADRFGIDAWDQSVFSRCFVHLTNAQQYRALTGRLPPHRPPKPRDYSAAGIPWFDYYKADSKALSGARVLRSLDSLAAQFRKQGRALPDNQPTVISSTMQLGDARGKTVRDNW